MTEWATCIRTYRQPMNLDQLKQVVHFLMPPTADHAGKGRWTPMIES